MAYIIGGGGGGGGMVVNEATAAALSDGESLTVTHPAVPLASGEILFSALATLAGSATAYSPSSWTDYDLNTGGATWVKDVGVNGHFSVNPGPFVVPGCRIWFSIGGGLYAGIESMGPDPTVPSSVVLDGTYASSTIEAIHAVYGSWADIYGYGTLGGVYPDYGGAAAPYLISDALISAGGLQMTGTFDPPSAASVNNATAFGAISIDGGTTWQVYDGVAWQVLALAPDTLAANGMVIPGGFWVTWLDSAGGVVPGAAWDDLLTAAKALGGSAEVRIAVGFDAGGLNASISTLAFNTVGADLVQPLAVPTFGFSLEGFQVYRLSTTDAIFFWRAPMAGTYSDFRVQVWTL